MCSSFSAFAPRKSPQRSRRAASVTASPASAASSSGTRRRAGGDVLASVPTLAELQRQLQQLGVCLDRKGHMHECKPSNGPIFGLGLGSKAASATKAAKFQRIVAIIAKYVQRIMIDFLGYRGVLIPTLAEATVPRAQCPIFTSTEFASKECLLFIIQGSGRGLEPGIWSRTLCMKKGLSVGSMLPQLNKAKQAGYGVVVTNPNAQSYTDQAGNRHPIIGSGRPEEHAKYVWERFVVPAAAKHVFVMAYGYGGEIALSLIGHLAQLRSAFDVPLFLDTNTNAGTGHKPQQEPVSALAASFNRIAGIATIESTHHIDPEKEHPAVVQMCQEKMVNWCGSNRRDLGYRIDVECQNRSRRSVLQKMGCMCISSGEKSGSHTALSIRQVLNQMFNFFKLARKILGQTRASRNVAPPISLQFWNEQVKMLPPAQPKVRVREAGVKWNPDTDHCENCNAIFTFFRRRHHCRMCGHVVCDKCSPNKMVVPGYEGVARVCNQCFEIESGQTSAIKFNRTENGISKLGVQDFTLIQKLGSGAYGQVYLVRHRKSDSLYAMKVLKKDKIKNSNQVEMTLTERWVLAETSHPFLTSLQFAFQSARKLYLVMDYMVGGDLFKHLQDFGPFSIDEARFYAAEIVSAISFLHSKAVVYRDLKPENVLIDSEGHLNLTDFGLAKRNVTSSSGAATFVGSPVYLAPEVLEMRTQGGSSGYGKAVDWWSLGTLIYEMLVGAPPFIDENRERMYQKIQFEPLVFPDELLLPSAQGLIELLLTRDPSLRLGSGPDGSDNVRNSPFFNSIDWVALESRELTPPWIPPVDRDGPATQHFGGIQEGGVNPSTFVDTDSETRRTKETNSGIHSEHVFKDFSYHGTEMTEDSVSAPRSSSA